jgi:hypothetical protein
MADQKDTRSKTPAAKDRRASALACLLESYEIYGTSHAWPACLDRPSEGGAPK